MLIATEKKTGTKLDGVFSQQLLDTFISMFNSTKFRDEHGEPNIELSDYAKSELRVLAVRKEIDTAAQPLTREGVIADVSALLVVGLAQTVKAIAAGKDLAAVQAAVASLQPFADAVLSKLATPADMQDPTAAIAAGKVVMPYMAKGDAAKVVTNMASLANGVSLALLASRKAGV